MALTKVFSPMLDLRLDPSQADTNTAAGIEALKDTIAAPATGPNGQINTAYGYQALKSNTVGYGNTAVGYKALSTAATLDNTAQTAIGAHALENSTTGGGNSAVGHDACFKNTTGSSNTAFGKGALYSNDTGSYNVAIGLDAFGTGTYPAAGKSGDFNVAIGVNAMTQAINSNDNVAVGNEASIAQTTLTNTVAVGSGALRGDPTLTVTNAATATTAVGYRAGYTAGAGFNNNTLLGSYSGYFGATGDQNVAVGTSALYGASGTQAFNQNVAVGFQSMYSASSASQNVAVGQSSLYSAGNGSGHVALGFEALYSSGNGSLNNSAVGNTAGRAISSGDNNTCLGNAAGTSTSPFNITTENNRVVVGDSNITNAYIQVAWTVVSDLRDKVVLGEVPHGLDFVTKLKPIKYQFKQHRDSSVAHGSVKYGFGAQDILALEGESPVIVDAEVEDKLKITESHLVPILVKAIQELKAEFEAYKLSHP